MVKKKDPLSGRTTVRNIREEMDTANWIALAALLATLLGGLAVWVGRMIWRFSQLTTRVEEVGREVAEVKSSVDRVVESLSKVEGVEIRLLEKIAKEFVGLQRELFDTERRLSERIQELRGGAGGPMPREI